MQISQMASAEATHAFTNERRGKSRRRDAVLEAGYKLDVKYLERTGLSCHVRAALPREFEAVYPDSYRAGIGTVVMAKMSWGRLWQIFIPVPAASLSPENIARTLAKFDPGRFGTFDLHYSDGSVYWPARRTSRRRA